MSEEVWKAVHGFEGKYEVSSLGRIKSLERECDNENSHVRERLLKLSLCAGYQRAILYKGDGVRHGRLVHRIVLEAFHGPSPEGTEACHNNGDRLDNRAENLRWDTRSNNARDRYKHGTAVNNFLVRRGEGHHKAKIKRCEALRIKEALLFGAKQKDLVNAYGISSYIVHDIARGKTWRTGAGA